MIEGNIKYLESILKRHIHGNDAQKKEALEELKKYGFNSSSEAYDAIRNNRHKANMFRCECEKAVCVDDRLIQKC